MRPSSYVDRRRDHTERVVALLRLTAGPIRRRHFREQRTMVHQLTPEPDCPSDHLSNAHSAGIMDLLHTHAVARDLRTPNRGGLSP
jgi:hypothetical protein